VRQELARHANGAVGAGLLEVLAAFGNQAHAGEPIRRAVELLRAGILGRVTVRRV
jgi:hypothetical protein